MVRDGGEFGRKRILLQRMLFVQPVLLVVLWVLALVEEGSEVALFLFVFILITVVISFAEIFTQFPHYEEDEDRFLFGLQQVNLLFGREVYGVIPFSEVAQVEQVVDRKRRRTAYVIVSMMNGDRIFLVDRETAMSFISALKRRRKEDRIVRLERDIGRWERMRMELKGGKIERRNYPV